MVRKGDVFVVESSSRKKDLLAKRKGPGSKMFPGLAREATAEEIEAAGFAPGVEETMTEAPPAEHKGDVELEVPSKITGAIADHALNPEKIAELGIEGLKALDGVGPAKARDLHEWSKAVLEG